MVFLGRISTKSFSSAFAFLTTKSIPIPRLNTSLHSHRYFAIMATPVKVPYAAQDVQEVQTLIRNLEASTKNSFKNNKKLFSCKRVGYDVHNSANKLVVYSWRFQDWDYKRPDLPTYARGLFTGKNQKGQDEICIRGYDKFFNQEEVDATKWANIEQYSKGPYELSLKENGCIIFISGLWDGSLLVCSKHSTGPRDNELSHAEAGERWVDKQLAAIGKTRKELAKELRSRNATAVAELCDDDFEEHILAYEKDKAGLYLHGININLPEFMTYPGDQVQAFAEEWGFRKTDYLVMDDIAKTKSFLEEVAETGSYDGRDVEGFVIRCKSNHSGGKYMDWFFKYKFEEPYLMYRQWRECTKALISGRPPRFRKHEKITEEYLMYAKRQLAKNPGLGKAYAQNHGIINLRNEFLAEKNLKGSDIIRAEYALAGGAPEDTDRNIILVPIATLGCGKTTIALALTHLFNWGHVQNDNITGKGRPPRFTKEVLTQLEEKPVVFADRNNAQRHERKQLIQDVNATHPHVKLIALNFVHSPEAIEKIREVTQDRVFARGNNHQTIQAAAEPDKVVGIMEGFIRRFEPFNTFSPPDDGFESFIDLNPAAESRENLETIVAHLHNLYPKLFTDMPTSEDLDEAISYALSDYRPELRHEIGGMSNRERDRERNKGPKNQRQQIQLPLAPIVRKPKPLEYISINLPKTPIIEVLETAFASISSNKARFFRQLQQTRRIQPEFHVTLIHRASSKQFPELWQKYSELYSTSQTGIDPWDTKAGGKMGECKVLLEKIVWDNRIMAIVARIVDEGWEGVNQVAHVTVGTRGEDVKPKESNELLRRWIEVGSGDESGIGEVGVEGRVVLEGVVKGVLSR